MENSASPKPTKTDLSSLNDRQRDAVISEEKRLLVLAGAGSGKTKTLVEKLVYLIKKKSVSAFFLGYVGSGSISIHGGAQPNHSRGYYAAPYDSTQGVPNYVFIGFWIIIILFFIRLGWEYRDEIFKKKE